MSVSALLIAADTSPSIQFATVLGSPPKARTASSKYAAISARLREHGSVVGGQPVVALEARLHRARQLRHRRADALDPRGVDGQRRQVRVGEVAVVLRVFLAAHRPRLAAVGIVEARLLHDRAALLDQLRLSAHLEVDRLLQEAEAVEVLDLAIGVPRRRRRAAARGG